MVWASAGELVTGVTIAPPGLLNLFNAGDFRNFFFDIAFDAHVEGHGAAWAADACAVEANADDTFGGDFDEFNVAAVGLHCRPDAADDVFNAFEDGLWSV